MRKQLLTLAVAAGLFAVAGPAIADHNSANGEGWANMPNDIHNTRIETKQNDDNEAFRDFVKYGEGSTSVNRFATEDTQPNQAAAQNGAAKAVKNQGGVKAMNQDQVKAMNQDQVKAMNQNKVETKTATKDQSRIETRSQLRIDSPATSRPDFGATSMRSGGSRAGGRR